jgi:hypothetical protein
MKGVAVSEGKRAAQVVGVVLFVVVIAALIAILIAQSKGGGKAEVPGAGAAGGGGRAVGRAAGGGGTAGATAPRVSPATGGATTAVVVPRGHGRYGGGGGRGRVYRSPPRVHTGVHLGLHMMVPMGSHEHTHDGQVADDDSAFAGDELRVSMTLVSAHDGRVLWHIRDSVDVEADKPQDLERFVRKYMGLIPPSLAPGQPAAGR